MTAPLYLSGHLAPVAEEVDGHDLPVTGALPPELNGRYFRNGPNPSPGQDPGHWFTGHGMLHGIRLHAGRARWYRNRWVRTAALAGAPGRGPDGRPDLSAVTANTSVIRHGGRILALVENGLPYEVSDELDTRGAYDFDGRLTTAMTAHPKEDPVTGDLHFFGYSALAPFLTYHRATANGALVESREIPVGGPTMMHDFAITERHVVWLDLPVVFDRALLRKGMPYRWDDTYRARIGVMPQRGSAPVRWFEVDPGYVFHVGNAREDAEGRIILDAVRYNREAFVNSWAAMGAAGSPRAQNATGHAQLHQWTLDPRSGRVSEQPLDDRRVEFPTLNETLVGRPSRYRYAVHGDGLVKYDLHSGAGRCYDAGPGQAPGEAVFVPTEDGGAEDDGWLLTIVSDRAGRGSALVVLDATDLTRMASVDLPQRVPAGFHGNWLPDI
ncbi:carotenoid oxygenase family protein [Streptomyces sp. RB6PN25]|uniref:Dioxygenase n=1 Tax=Streptomyces humicola TaxID=2953240 RepID=A0ABT1PP62_9ACTN|nr:carotenoid oxygenase family protein [Streptomyces humicola]MCQ4079467.1 carotenoid oxygenase family protein [Streptomyces humicola]